MLKRKNRMLILCMLIASILILTLGCFFPTLQNDQVVKAYGETGNEDFNVDLPVLVDGEEIILSSTEKQASGENGFTNVAYIDNADYFLVNPQHFNADEGKLYYNPKGVCTTIAMQLLLGYHNYYSDRRLIPATSGDKQFLANDFGDPSYHPAVNQGSSLSQEKPQIGTSDAVFEEIFALTSYGSVPGVGQALPLVLNGTRNFLNQYAPTVSSNVVMAWELIDQAEVLAEIQAGRPVIVGRHPLREENDFHVVVAYGYATYNNELGVIVHNGTGTIKKHMWMPISWCAFQLRMVVSNHTHTFVDAENNIAKPATTLNSQYKYTHREFRCTTCGANTVDELYTLNATGDTLVGVEYPLQGKVAIPEALNGNTVTKIAPSAFAEHSTAVTEFILPNGITEIGANAFSHCSSLTSITFKSGVTSIGSGVFAWSPNVNIVVNSGNTNYCAENNVLYNKAKTQLISTGKIPSSIEVPATVQSVSDRAFAGNSNLGTIRFANSPTIGNEAFRECLSLTAIHFDGQTPPASIGTGVLTDTACGIYVPYPQQNAYKAAFANDQDLVSSVGVAVVFMDGVQELYRWDSYDGTVIATLPTPSKVGYDFMGWYDNPEFTGNAYQNGFTLNREATLVLYARFVPKQYTITLDTNGGAAITPSSMTVTFGESFTIAGTTAKEGNYLTGWFVGDTQYATAAGESMRPWDIAENVTLSARWAVERYKVRVINGSFVAWLGAEGWIETESDLAYGQVIAAIDLVPAFRASPLSFREGEIFDRFQPVLVNGETWTAETIPDFGENGTIITLDGEWRKEQHTIWLTAGNAFISTSKIEVEYGTPITLPTPIETGYTFDGWYKEDDYTTLVEWTHMPDLTPNMQDNGSIQLHAKMDPITYNVAYNPNGGTGAMTTIPVQYDQDYILSANVFTRTNYEFIGWATSATGNVVYTNGATVRNLSTTNGQTVTLYAVWRGRQYNIRYHNIDYPGETIVLYYNNQAAPNTYEYGVGLDVNSLTAVCQGTTTEDPQLIFLGWFTNMNFTTWASDISVTQTGDVHLYAKWRYDAARGHRQSTYTIAYSSWVSNSYDAIYTGLASNGFGQQLKAMGIQYVSLTFKFQMWEGADGYQYIHLFKDPCVSESMMREVKLDYGGDSTNGTPGVYAVQFHVVIDDIIDSDWLYVRYSESGMFSNTWYNKEAYYELAYLSTFSDLNDNYTAFKWSDEDPYPGVQSEIR